MSGGMSQDRELALAVVRHLIVGGTIGGVRFGVCPQLLIHDTPPLLRGQVYINLQARWSLFPSFPASEPESEECMPELAMEDQLVQISRLRDLPIRRVDFGVAAAHLLLTLEGGSVFFLWGKHEQYETWQVGVAFGEPGETWEVVACPGGRLAVWAPSAFRVPDAG